MMTEQETTAAAAPRCLGRIMARELTAGEIELVGGGISYTGVHNLDWGQDYGYPEFEFSDYNP